MTRRGANAAAWSFVLANHDTIERLAAKRARQTNTDADDVRNESIVYLVARHDDYDSAKGTATTWIWYAVRYAATRINRQRFGGDRLQLEPDDAVIDRLPSNTTTDDTDRRVLVNRILHTADDAQRDAAVSVLEGWSGVEIRARLGVSTHGRNMRLYRLRDRLNVSP